MIYLIGGENTYASNQSLIILTGKFLSGNLPVNKAFASDDNEVNKLLSGIDNFGFFGPAGVTLIKGFEEAGKDLQEKMMAFSTKKIDLIIQSNANWDKRSRFYKHFSKDKNTKLEEYKFLRPIELHKWLVSFLREKGLTLDRDLVQELVFRVGNNQNILASEVEKLVILHEQGIQIDEKVFEQVVVDTQDVDVWELIDNLRTNKGRAFKLFDYLSANLEYEHLMSLLARQIRLIFLALNAGSREALQAFGVRPYVAGKLLSESRGFTLAKIKKLYGKMVSIDISVKSGKLDKGLALDILLVAF